MAAAFQLEGEVSRAVCYKAVCLLFIVVASCVGTSSVASKYEELECLYAAVGKVIYEGLTNYEKATNANPSQLFGKSPGTLKT